MFVDHFLSRWLSTVATVLVIMATLRANAQIFLDPARYSTPSYDSGIVVADFNRDGNWDVATVGDYLSVFLGKADGTFRSRVDYALFNVAYSIAVGDFNGDGYPDLAVTSLNIDPHCRTDRGRLSIFINKGDGTFRPRMDYVPAGCVPGSVVVADFNNDGKLDVVNLDGVGPNLQQPGDVGLFLGNGDGSFQAPVPFPTGPDPSSLVAGDFNGDNNPDLAVSNIGNSLGHPLVSVLLGNGDGTFQAHVDFGNPTAAGVGNIVVADFNGDGKPDLAVAADQASIFLGNGDGTFQNQIDIQDAGLLGSLMVGDFNNDGVPDLIGGYNGDMAVLIGRGDGTFRMGDIYGWPVVFGVAVDFNKDGKTDLIASGGSFDAVGVLLGNGDGTFPASRDFLLPGNGDVVADFNLDGKLDVATTNAIMLGNGDGTFQPPVTYFSGNLQFFSVTGGDFNNDGKPDLVVATYDIPTATSSLSVFLGNGNGSFRKPLNYTVPPTPFSIATADFNGDQKLDLVAPGAPNDDGVIVLLGNGDGSFQSPVQYGTAPAPVRVSVGDLRDNGKQDLLVATVCPPTGCNGDNTGSLSILFGNGDGTFQTHVDYTLSCTPVAISTGKFNGDGLLDVAIDCPGVVNIFLGNGDGTIQPPLQYPHSGYGSTVVVGDFNGDGNTDLAIPSGGYTVALLLGNGDGTFQPEQDYVTGGSATSAIGDFNGDGKPDLVSAGIVLINIADFPTFLLSVSLAGSGAGTVTSTPAGIDCGNTCSANFVRGVSVTLTPAPAPGSMFAGWSGDCSGGGNCTVTMNAAKNVTATFNLMPDFGISASALSPASVNPGQSATSTIQITALNGFSSSVSLTCSVSPSPQFTPQCSISPNSVTPGTPATLTVTTTAPNVSAYPSGHPDLLYTAWLSAFGLTLLGMGVTPTRTRRPGRPGLLVCCLIIANLAFLAACGGGGISNGGSHGSSGTPPGSYTITVTGTSGGLVHSATVTLNVQ